MRELDRLATGCLRLGVKRKLRVLDRDLVARAKREHDDDETER
ncbi:MAG TPA: hypothetical protein VF331_09655 [Polyangiales bacterium]